MRLTTVGSVLAVSLLVGTVAATARSRLQTKLAPGPFESNKGDFNMDYHESFTIDRVLSMHGFMSVYFANSDHVKCELSATGPCTFQLNPEALLANGNLNHGGVSWVYLTDNCTTFSFESAMDRTKASILDVTKRNEGGMVRVTGGCTLTNKRRGLRAPANPKPTHRQIKDDKTTWHLQTLHEVTVAPNSYVPFHLPRGLTSIAWNLTCPACVDNNYESYMVYYLAETEHWLQVEAAYNGRGESEGGQDWGLMACNTFYMDVYSDDSARSASLNASRAYTFVLFSEKLSRNVSVSGTITTTSSA